MAILVSTPGHLQEPKCARIPKTIGGASVLSALIPGYVASLQNSLSKSKGYQRQDRQRDRRNLTIALTQI